MSENVSRVLIEENRNELLRKLDCNTNNFRPYYTIVDSLAAYRCSTKIWTALWLQLYIYFFFFRYIDGAPDMTGYYQRDEERAGYRAARDTEALTASYERFLRTGVSPVGLLHYRLLKKRAF